MPQSGPQTEAIRKHWIDEVFYGGAVGGGKSDFLLGDFAQDVPNYGSGWQGILFRRTYPELSDLIRRSQEIYPPWFPGVVWHESDKEWRWPNGTVLRMRYLEHSSDWMRYWGHAYTWIGWDELPSWPDMLSYQKMKARLRSASSIPNKRIRATGNPGGPGHSAVKHYFGIDQYPLGGALLKDALSGMRRMFIRSKLSDNKILLDSDPHYSDRLRSLGSPELVRAWLEGDWSVVQGAFFPEFSDRHVVLPVELPAHWTRFRAFDWGSARPFCCLWFAVSDGELPQFPKDALIIYREWYGGENNVGLKMRIEDVADGILAREGKSESIKYSVADPACAIQDGGPSMIEVFADRKVFFDPGDNKRIPGWSQVRSRLKGEDGKPMLYIFSTCKDLIRTIPTMQHDEVKPEDIDSSSDDHAIDAARYGCMSRPYVTVPIPKKRDILDKPSLDELWDYQPKLSGRI